jgi:hypothetical protein
MEFSHTQPPGRKLSQESPMLTAHRPSFPTCLFHPRRVHLLCHLDSPSAASLPYLGLQEQTRTEVSGLYGSYRVPSRSSLLPLRTLSPGGVAHRPTSLTQSSTAWSQQPTRKTDTSYLVGLTMADGLTDWLHT